MREIQYDRYAAVYYARKWALGRNPAFYDFENIGGDCTNFASQSIYAGCGVMNYTPTYGWYYISLDRRAPAWTGVEFLYRFLVTNRSVGPYAEEVAQSEVLPGDIVQFGDANGRFYHSPVIVATYPQILLAAHSNDVLDVPLSYYSYERVRFLHILGARVW